MKMNESPHTLILCDIDGVLADCSHRLHWLKEKDYDLFYGEEMSNDKKITNGISLLYLLHDWHIRREKEYMNPIVYITGRPERTRSITRDWLNRILPFHAANGHIIMRKDEDHRPSSQVKLDLIHNLPYDINSINTVFFIDDDPENVKAVCTEFPNITGITFSINRMKGEK